MALISEDIYKKKSDAFNEHREKYVKNLLKSGKKHQFKKGKTGTRRISQHEREVAVERIENVNKKRKGKLEACPVCKMKFNHLESHLYNAHKLIKV